MKYIRFYEEFTEETLKTNNDTYNNYLRKSSNRSGMVAWERPRSQDVNFRFITKYLNDNDSILDYGCGIGDFIKYLEKYKKISDYLGVDINDNFINMAKKDYPNNEFQLIKNVNEIKGKWDSVCAIGVFTWFITKNDFINTIHKLYEVCNKQVLITCLYDAFAYDSKSNIREQSYWLSKYRQYNEELFTELFPDYNIEFIIHARQDMMLVKINK